MATCKFALLPCPKECTDDTNKVRQFMRKDLGPHLEKDCPNRDHSCEHCGERSTYENIINIHDQECLRKPLSCPISCGATMQRQHILQHVTTECKLTVIPCKYKRLGCDKLLKRQDMAAHEADDKFHLHMAVDTTAALESKTVKLEIKTVELENEIAALKAIMNGGPLNFKLTDYQKRKDSNECVESPSYYTSAAGYNLAIKVYANGGGDGKGTHISVFTAFLKGKHDAQLKWPFLGKVTFMLLNQLEDKNHHQKTMTVAPKDKIEVGSTWGYPKFVAHSALEYDPVNNVQYLKDDMLHFKMSVTVDDQLQ